MIVNWENAVVKNNVGILLAMKAGMGKRITHTKVAEETGLHPVTVDNWVANKITQYNASAILAFCKYFNCTIGELLEIVEAE